jgi:hypothetical protein
MHSPDRERKKCSRRLPPGWGGENLRDARATKIPLLTELRQTPARVRCEATGRCRVPMLFIGTGGFLPRVVCGVVADVTVGINLVFVFTSAFSLQPSAFEMSGCSCSNSRVKWGARASRARRSASRRTLGVEDVRNGTVQTATETVALTSTMLSTSNVQHGGAELPLCPKIGAAQHALP